MFVAPFGGHLEMGSANTAVFIIKFIQTGAKFRQYAVSIERADQITCRELGQLRQIQLHHIAQLGGGGNVFVAHKDHTVHLGKFCQERRRFGGIFDDLAVIVDKRIGSQLVMAEFQREGELYRLALLRSSVKLT